MSSKEIELVEKSLVSEFLDLEESDLLNKAYCGTYRKEGGFTGWYVMGTHCRSILRALLMMVSDKMYKSPFSFQPKRKKPVSYSEIAKAEWHKTYEWNADSDRPYVFSGTYHECCDPASCPVEDIPVVLFEAPWVKVKGKSKTKKKYQIDLFLEDLESGIQKLLSAKIDFLKIKGSGYQQRVDAISRTIDGLLFYIEHSFGDY